AQPRVTPGLDRGVHLCRRRINCRVKPDSPQPSLRSPKRKPKMQFWIIQTLNSVAFGGLLFLLSSGFSLIFGLMRIPNLAHGAFFMLGAYFGYTLLQLKLHFWLAALVGGIGVGLIGIVMERVVLRRLAGNEQGQVLVTLGVSFIIADICLLVWT